MPQYYQPEPKQPAHKPRAKDHEAYMTMSILAFLLPPVGFIIGIVYLTRSNVVERKLGEHVLAMSVIWGIVGFFVWMVIGTLMRASMY